jgi:hypothetical protein
MLLFPLRAASASPAQVNGSAASGARSPGARPASGASASPNPTPARSGVTPSGRIPRPPTGPNHDRPNNSGSPRPAASGIAYYPYLYPVPYAGDGSGPDASGDEDDNDADYQGGPTIFDRRGSGAASYLPLAPPSAEAQAGEAPAADSGPDSDPPQDPTILVFKDGHQLEVANYAIIAQTLYDLTPGHPRKIALADLDVSATEKQNDDRGTVFELPVPTPAD